MTKEQKEKLKEQILKDLKDYEKDPDNNTSKGYNILRYVKNGYLTTNM